MDCRTCLNSYADRTTPLSRPSPTHTYTPRWRPAVLHSSDHSSLSSLDTISCAFANKAFESLFQSQARTFVAQAQQVQNGSSVRVDVTLRLAHPRATLDHTARSCPPVLWQAADHSRFLRVVKPRATFWMALAALWQRLSTRPKNLLPSPSARSCTMSWSRSSALCIASHVFASVRR